MTFCKVSKGAKPALAALALSLSSTLSPTPAQAIFLEADHIEASGSLSTVDLWFFSFNALSSATIKVNYVDGPPIPGGDPDLIIYLDDGTFANIFASDTAAGSDPEINAIFPAGSYIGLVANHPLALGEFGPTHADAGLVAGAYEYEFNGPEPDGGDIALNCILSGNIDGGYTKLVLGQDTCQTPPRTSIPEPASLGLFCAGLLGLFAARRRRRPNSDQLN